MEVEMQLDDDLFFAELSKRITVLITDDDDADFVVAAATAAAVQFPDAMHLPPGFSMSSHVPSMLAPPTYTLFHHAASYGAATIANSAGDAGRTWSGSKGTGVFIPRSAPGGAHSKRKGRNWSGSRARAKAEGIVAAGTPVKRRA
ncbi:uncharacterized protein LOC124648839 [Lolium rigidum]|uniref:uncharacterized protein LOC124648839 n=1 Tax=Lolium rigidum TaxID=89674 RepID=UPI001F5C98E7|nr:uncharacterized protein LOC124648839 [Lolium rigidum]